MAQISGHKLCNVTVPGIIPQRRLKAFLWLGAPDGIGERGVLKLNIKQIDLGDDVFCVFQIDLIANIVGQGQRITGRLGGGIGNGLLDSLPFFIRNGDLHLMSSISGTDGNGISLTGNGMIAEVRRPHFVLLLRLNLGQRRVCFIYDFPTQALAKVGHIVVQPHKLRFRDGKRRPFDSGITLNDGIFFIGIEASVLIRLVCQHKICNNGFVLLVDLPDSPCILFLLFQLFPDIGSINVLKIIQLLLGKESITSLHKYCKGIAK